ncbi:MAG: hypothetical protein Ct9H90mP16_11270 [Candidatus Poseidoniales archaeon]|nr:MAG: hypothetical protein Ct9H90mP16_11270 [Candidatus Poseidoniales archaeon]
MTSKEYSLKKDDLGAIGIGAMIIFIALILVAAVASTIIIKTAEELQQRAQKTGDDTQDNLGGKILIQGAYVSEESATGGSADEITLIVQLSSGSDTTLLADMEWHMACDDGTAVAGVNAGVFTVATELDGTALGAAARLMLARRSWFQSIRLQIVRHKLETIKKCESSSMVVETPTHLSTTTMLTLDHQLSEGDLPSSEDTILESI